MTAQEIRSMVESNGWSNEYRCIAVRTQWEPFKIGNIKHRSSVWSDGNQTKSKLSGISATDIESDCLGAHTGEYRWARYHGDHQAILGCQEAEQGEDSGEVVMKNAVVLYIIK